MAEQLIENSWKPIQLSRGGSNGYAISNYAVSSSWYNRQIDSSGDRYEKLRKYYEADKCSTEISKAMDIIAEDITSANADEDPMFHIGYDEDSKVKKTTIKILNSVLDVWQDRTKMGTKFFDRVRETLVMGITFYYKLPSGRLKKLPSERMIGYILSEEDENIVTHYIYDKSRPRFDKVGINLTNRQKLSEKDIKDMIIPVDSLLIMKIGEHPFGESLIEKVYKTWKQMTLLEDAVVIYRVVRAPERRVYYIDTGNLQGAKREKAIESQRLRLMQKQAAKAGSVTTDYDPHSTSEDIFIPTNSTGKGSRIETLPGGSNLGEMGDLDWFAKKLAAGLRVPFSMLDIQGDNSQHNYSDMRVGQMYHIEMRYLGHVNRLKNQIVPELNKHYIEFCKERDLVVPEECELKVNTAHSFSEYRDIELNQTKLNVFNSTLSITSISKKMALQKYLNFDHEDIKRNELEKLGEKGITEDQIKKMTQTEIDNIVYGDGRLGSKYGLKPEENQGF